jgi:uncharacterized repeat protein (TIGR01451 family)
VRRSIAEKKTAKLEKKTGNGMKAAFLAAAVLATAGVVFYFGTAVHAAKASGAESADPGFAERRADAHQAIPAKALSLPMFFEPNQGQTAPPVKFIARGAGYGLFLTADEAVLVLQRAVANPRTATAIPEHPASSVIRMKLDGANSAPRVSGVSPLPGKSNYFIGNDRSKWRSGIPQFGRVQYQAVYPGVDLVYYGDRGQLEYDFRVAPAADPNQIAVAFQGASARIVPGVPGDSGVSGDLVLSTATGDVRFHAPRVYQDYGSTRKSVAGSFRQLAANKIGFTIGDYDHLRELVIDPILTYSTYIGAGGEGPTYPASPSNLVQVAIDPSDNIYLAGSTTSANFPVTNGSALTGTQNIFIATVNPALPPAQQLLYATYLGSSGTDMLAGIAVDSSRNIYVAGTTTSTNSSFPTTTNAFQTAPAEPGTHGFLSAITFNGSTYSLTYSTYLAGFNESGTASDTVTGLAINSGSCGTQSVNGVLQAVCYAYVTGVTTSDDPVGYNFPANPNAYQIQSNSPGNPQFFASQLYTGSSGAQSMLYSTYFGGANFAGALDANVGGGIAVDPPPNNTPNMYFTGTTNMLPGTPTVPGFPLLDAQQTCLNQAGVVTSPCNSTTDTDAFAAKIYPGTSGGSSLLYSTYLGGSGNDNGNAIAVDTSANAYIIGTTDSTDFMPASLATIAFQQCLNNTTYNPANNPPCPTSSAQDAFIAKIGNNLSGSEYPLTYFTYLGGSGNEVGQGIQVDSVQAVHAVGTTFSPTNFPAFPPTNFPIVNPIQPQPPTSSYNGGAYSGAGDAFVALISTTSGVTEQTPAPNGDYVTYLGGSGLDQGTGVAVDPVYGATYVAGATQSINLPVTSNAYQPALNGAQNAFVSVIGANSSVNPVTFPSAGPAPNPVAAGNQVTFTFYITNNGPDPASQVTFNALYLPTSILQSPATAIVESGGSCGPAVGTGSTQTIECSIAGVLAVNAVATVEVNMTPIAPAIAGEAITISGNASANNSPAGLPVQQLPAANVVDFYVKASTSTPVIDAGVPAYIQVTFCPLPGESYNATITPSQTTSPSMVTSPAPTFNPTTVQLHGSGCGTTQLTIPTVARPAYTGSLFHRGSFYAAWLPIGGLSLVGLGLGASRKRRRWLIGAVLGLIAGIILLQPGCGSSSSSIASSTGTKAQTYEVLIKGSAGAGAEHTAEVQLTVD